MGLHGRSPQHPGVSGGPPAGFGATLTRPWREGLVLFLSRLLLRVFFRRVEVEGLEHVPARGGVLVVSWHPNGLIDPILILACIPRWMVFGARDGLFRWPLLGSMMRLAGTVPIRRAMDGGGLDAEARQQANQRSLHALAKLLAQGGVTCLFPEGTSHDEPHLIPLRTGAARLYYEARALNPEARPAILPVGLHYDAKKRFRSHVLVRFHAPLVVPEALDPPPRGEPDDALDRARTRSLTELIERELREVVHPTEDWETHHLLGRAARLLRAERARRAGVELGRPGMLERHVAFWRVWQGCGGGREGGREEPRVREMLRALAEYDADLRALGLQDAELDHPPARARPLQLLTLALQVAAAYFLFPTLILVGGLVNLAPGLLLMGGIRVAARQRKDVATLKLLGGAVLFPTAWTLAAFCAARASNRLHELFPAIPARPYLAAAVVVLMAVIGGALSLRYLRLARETARALRVRFTRMRRRRAIETLRRERARLADMLEALEEGRDLPGAVTPEGIVTATEDVAPGGRP